MKLFENKHRKNDKPANHTENLYEFCDNSSLDEINNIRILLNKWFDVYPDEEKVELKRRFETEFHPALFELFLHELFFRQGFKISIHPSVENSNKKPDFLMSKGDINFYVEAKVATSKSDIEVAYDNKLNVLYDAINTIESPDFLLGIHSVSFISDKQPAIRPILNFLRDYINDFDVNDLTSKLLEGKCYRDLSLRKYTDEDNIEIYFFLIPKASGKRNMPGRFIGIYPDITFNEGNEASIQSSLIKKSSRYGNLDKPYLICINSLGDFLTNEYDAKAAIWGSLEISFSSDPKNHDLKMSRRNDGFFYNKYGPAHKRVSGVLITRLQLANLPKSEYWLSKNPFADKELDFNTLELSYTYVEDKKLQTVKKKSVEDILSN